MLKLSEALGEWNPGEQSSRTDPIVLLEAGWEEIVGSDVARNSCPTGIVNGVLTVTTRSNAWSHQLSFLSDHLLRAVAARLPDAGLQRLRCRVGRVTARRRAPPLRRPSVFRRTRGELGETKSPSEALARFREDVESRRDACQAQGWHECAGCAAMLSPDDPAYCAACSAARAEHQATVTARLLFEAPWLGYTGTTALVDGLKEGEYERIRSRMLAHWWGTLARARAARRLSRDGRERLIASSYVLLQSKLAPEEIMPATVRNILGDELHDLLYGGE